MVNPTWIVAAAFLLAVLLAAGVAWLADRRAHVKLACDLPKGHPGRGRPSHRADGRGGRA